MPCDLECLWNRKSIFTYATSEGKKLKKSTSTEENASFVVRWAAELYGDWATWLHQILPGCTVSYKTSTLRIVNKIQEMKNKNEITKIEDGWKKLTDMLRASFTCSSAY